MKVVAIKDETFDTLIEQSVIGWMNEKEKEWGEPHNIHVTELNHCLLMSAGDRLFEVSAETLSDVNMMFLGVCLERAFVRYGLLANIFPLEIVKKRIPRSNTILIGEIDIDTARRGIFEIKSKQTYYALPKAEELGATQLIDVQICGSPKIVGRAPVPNHIDQNNGYIIVRGGIFSHIIYFSRTAQEGFTLFSMRYDKDEINEIRRILYERGLEYDDAITEAFQYSNLDAIVKILNDRLTPEPSGLCAYCTYGGTYSNKYKKGRKKGLKDFCSTDLEVRRGFAGVKTLVPKNIYYDEKFRDQIYKSIIKMFQKRFTARLVDEPPLPPIKEYRYELLFFCPRLSNYMIHNYDLIYGSGLTDPNLFPRTTSQIAIYFSRLALVEQLNEVLNPPRVIEEGQEPTQQYLRVEFESSGTARALFIQDYPIIEGYPTHIVPSAKIRARVKERRPPHSSDLLHIGAAQVLSETEFRLCYYPIKGTKVASYKLEIEGDIDLDLLRLGLNERADQIFGYDDGVLKFPNGRPDPKIWCLWCPVRYLADEEGKSLCPYGVKWVKEYFEGGGSKGRRIEDLLITEEDEISTEDEPFPYLDDMGKF